MVDLFDTTGALRRDAIKIRGQMLASEVKRSYTSTTASPPAACRAAANSAAGRDGPVGTSAGRPQARGRRVLGEVLYHGEWGGPVLDAQAAAALVAVGADDLAAVLAGVSGDGVLLVGDGVPLVVGEHADVLGGET